MQKVLHKAGLIEVGAQQAAASNLGYNSYFRCHKFYYIFFWDAGYGDLTLVRSPIKMILIMMISNLYWTWTKMVIFSPLHNLISIFGAHLHFLSSTCMTMHVASLTLKLGRKLTIA